MQKNIASRRFMLLTALCGGLLTLATGAHAQSSSPTIDYGALATSTKDGVFSALGAGAPVAFAVLAGMLGLGVVWRLVKRGAKSV